MKKIFSLAVLSILMVTNNALAGGGNCYSTSTVVTTELGINVTTYNGGKSSTSASSSSSTTTSYTNVCPPTSNAGGPYLNVPCTASKTSVQLMGSARSFVTPNTLKYKWTTNCPNGTFNDATIINPILTFTAATADKLPVHCTATLKVTDAKGYSTTSYPAEIAVGTCAVDCRGVIGGSAQVDRCGVCQGDGQSCVSCKPIDISGSQLTLDAIADAQRGLVLQGSSTVKAASKKDVRKQLKEINKQAHLLYEQNWRLAYSMPSVMLECGTTPACVEVSNVGVKTAYTANSNSFSDLIVRQKKLLPSSDKKNQSKLSKKLTQSQNLEKSAAVELATIPNSHDVCN